MKNSMLISALAVYTILMTGCGTRCDFFPVDLRIEHVCDPSVIETDEPRMSWINRPADNDVKGAVQSAYRVIVASTEAGVERNEGDVWDSGIVESDDSYLVKYNGAELASGSVYYWKVQVWDGNGRASGWSKAGRFGTGLKEDEWQAEWIGAPWQDESASSDYVTAPVFIKRFEADTTGLVSARAFVTGLGYFELALNGEKVGDDFLVPNQTNYGPRPGLVEARLPMEDVYSGSRVLYLAYDIMGNIKHGDNEIEGIVGNGFYNSHIDWVEPYGSPRFMCQMELCYSDGHRERIVTDSTWSVSESQIVFNDIYGGEIYDANKERNVVPVVIRNAPEGKLTAHTSPTDKILRRLSPRSVIKNDDGSYTVDFGEEISGWVALSGMIGERGDTVSVKYHSESPLGVHKYIMNGSGNESHSPRFTWYVFSKATITGVEYLDKTHIVAEAVGTDVAVDAHFESSDTLLNRIVDMWQRTQTDNMHGGIASDCPHRERSPYTGDGQVASAMVMATYDAAAFYEKWIRDMRDAQDPISGYVPNSAPWQPGCGGGVPWGAAMNIIPWEFYLNYGDRDVLAENYDAMKLQTDYMTTWLTESGTMLQCRPGLGSDEPFYWFNLGEWSVPDKLPSQELVHTFYMWMCADIMANAADVLGKRDDAAYYSNMAEKTKAAFHDKFYDEDAKSYGKYGSNVLALRMGVPEAVRADVAVSLRQEIEEENGSHLNTGIFGTRYLFEMLAENGMPDLAYKVSVQKTYPSYGYWIENGATTMWEAWNGDNSHNHPMFGGGLVWLYRNLAGLNYDREKPGYKHLIVSPTAVEGLDEVYYSKMTPYGEASSRIINGKKRTAEIVIPVGATATVYLPGEPTPREVGQGRYILSF